MRRRTNVSLFTLASLFALAGCLDTHDGYPVHGLPPSSLGRRPVPGVDAPMPDHWSRVFIGPLPRPKMSGYVRTERDLAESGNPISVHWVYDVDLKLVGVIGDNGHTTRFDRFGKPHFLGDLPIDKSVLAIYDFENPEENPVRLLAMPEPKD